MKQDEKIGRSGPIWIVVAILVSGALLPCGIMTIADSQLPIEELTDYYITSPGVALGWNLALGWPMIAFAPVAWRVLREWRSHVGFPAIGIVWILMLFSKAAGAILGFVEQGYLFLPLISNTFDVLLVASVTGWPGRFRYLALVVLFPGVKALSIAVSALSLGNNWAGIVVVLLCFVGIGSIINALRGEPVALVWLDRTRNV